MRNDNVNMHQKFQRNWNNNEGAINFLAKIPYGRTEGRKDGRKDGRTEGRKDGRTNVDFL